MEKIEIENRRNLKPLVIGVGVALGLLVVGCTVFLSVYMTQQSKKLEWVAFNGGYPNIDGAMHEETETDTQRKTILHVNAEGWKIGVNNSISLHDYEKGLLASRIMETGTCMVVDLVDSFEKATAGLAKIQRAGEAMDRPAREFESGTLIPQEKLSEELGERLANFCRGSPTYRLIEVPAGTLDSQNRQARAARAVARYCCIENTFAVAT